MPPTPARTGLEVDVRTEGEPRPLPPGADISAYRIVQEALTNVLKHAHAAEAQVVVAHLPECVEIVVSNAGPVATADQDSHGHGLAGMRERVALFGGSLEAGPTTDGWRLAARLPREPGA